MIQLINLTTEDLTCDDFTYKAYIDKLHRSLIHTKYKDFYTNAPLLTLNNNIHYEILYLFCAKLTNSIEKY